MKLPATGGTVCLVIPAFLDTMLQCCMWPVVCLSVYCSLCPRLWCRVSFQERSVCLCRNTLQKFVQHGRANWIKTVACQTRAPRLPADTRLHTAKYWHMNLLSEESQVHDNFSLRIGTGKLRMNSSQSVVTLPDIPLTLPSLLCCHSGPQAAFTEEMNSQTLISESLCEFIAHLSYTVHLISQQIVIPCVTWFLCTWFEDFISLN